MLPGSKVTKYLIALTLIFSLSPYLVSISKSETTFNGKLIVCCKCGAKETCNIKINGKKIIAYCARCFALQGKK